MSEIIAFVSLPFLMQSFSMQPYRQRLSKVFIIMGFWIFGVVASDLINGTGGKDFARGLLKPMFCLGWVFFITIILVKEYRAFIFYGCGLVLAGLQNYLFPLSAWTAYYAEISEYSATAFALSPVFMSGAAAAGTLIYTKSKTLAVIAFGCAAVALGAVGAPRNFAANMLLCSLVIIYIRFATSGMRRRARLKPSFQRMAGICVLGVVGMYGIFQLYILLASSGALGAEQWAKLQAQSSTTLGQTPLGLILGGRVQVFAAVLAILDNPLLGYGSWSAATLNSYLYTAAEAVGASASSLSRVASAEYAGVGHSVLFQIWAENGILSAIALMAIGAIAIQQILYVMRIDHRLAPLIIFIGISFMWDFIFSPFNTSTRFQIGFFLALYLTDELQRRVLLKESASFYRSMAPPPMPLRPPPVAGVPAGAGWR
ncbi:MAG: hypothetical protein ACFBZ8_02955 [Opitutales bacterium]